MKVFRAKTANSQHIDIDKISEEVANSPCSRFWVSEERAVIVIHDIIRGRPVLDTMRQYKREMFAEIHRRVMELQKKHPKLSLMQLVIKVVNSPAPKFYMKPRSVMQTIYKIRSGFYKRQKRYFNL